MPVKNFSIEKKYPIESVINMAEALGKMTGTVVVCLPVLQVEAAEPVLKALETLLPTVKGRKKYTKAAEPVNEYELPTP